MVRRTNEKQVQAVQAVRAMARLARTLERSSGDLNMAHYRVLAAVADGDERASRVAERLALGKPTVSAAVESLCKRGLLAREVSGDDRRVATLSPTPAGEAALAAVEELMVGRIDEILRRTDGPDEIVDALVRLGEALDKVAAERLSHRLAESKDDAHTEGRTR
jgi:DNA-binding MarR family transcriptional regulator